MRNLIKKDFILSKKVSIFAVIYALFIAGTGAYNHIYLISTLFYILGITMLVFVFVIYVNGYDDKYKSEIILNSLPMNRNNIVEAKYLMIIIVSLIACGIVYLFIKFIYIFDIIEGDKSLNMQVAVMVMNIVLIFYSIYYPVYFKVGEGMRTFNTILWILMLLGPNMLSKGMKALAEQGLLEKILSTLDIGKISLYLLGISLIIYYISLQISKRIYMKKEF